MGSSEPTLVPEWLRCNGQGNSTGSTAHHFGSANSHSDVPLLANSVRNRPSRSLSEVDKSRAILDQSLYVNSRRNSCNDGSSKHPYRSFSKSYRDPELEKEKERSAFWDFWEHDSSDPLGKDSSRRTRSMASRKQGDVLSHRVLSDSITIESQNHLHINGPAATARDMSSHNHPKVLFEKEFPSLGAEEKQDVQNVVRVASPGLTTAAQSLPIGSSALIGEGWSALAEVHVVTGSNNSAQPIHQPLVTSVSSTSASDVLNMASGMSNNALVTSNTTSQAPKTACACGPASGLNMAEALVQAPSVTRTAPQISIETQRIEQLAIKKVRQLTPLTPAMPKILHSSDKLKAKLNGRMREMSCATQGGRQPPSSLNVVGQSPRGGPVTPDSSNQSHGSKLFVLKPPWENGVPATPKDLVINSEICVGGRGTNRTHATPTMTHALVRSSNGSKAVMDSKPAVSSLSMTSTLEKRPLSSHAQSRSDFFKSVRNRTSVTATVIPGTSSTVQSPSEEKSCEVLHEKTSTSQQGNENDGLLSKDDSSNEAHKFSTEGKNSIPCAEVITEEEEAAFLRSLGWEENGEEEEGLTEEEITAFYEEVKKSRPSLNLAQGIPPTLSLLAESHASNVGGATSPRVSSSDEALKSN